MQAVKQSWARVSRGAPPRRLGPPEARRGSAQRARAWLLALGVCLVACSPARPAASAHQVRPETPDDVNIGLARERGNAQLFAWAPWEKATFERAKRERRFILLHGAAVWCHWCHVMEAVTYRDPEVGALLKQRFIAIRVDIDSRPDIEQRYTEWGWPATIVFDPEANEIGKYRGFIRPAELLEILRGAGAAASIDNTRLEPGADSASLSAMPWVAKRALRDMDYYYDEEQGGWGVRQKAPLGENAQLELLRAKSGDVEARKRALFSLRKQAALIDPVWGGIYQYSDGGRWDAPHYEKLMTYQAPNLEAYALAYELSGDAQYLKWARSIAAYVAKFLTAKNGAGFFVSQDADVGAHDPGARFIDGKVFYAANAAERKQLGVPWVDTHVYAEESGLMIAALTALARAGDAPAGRAASVAAAALTRSHVLADGRVSHAAGAGAAAAGGSGGQAFYLGDAAALGLALTRHADFLRQRGSAEAAALRATAERIAESLDAMWDPALGAFWGHTPDPNASGVFARRLHPFRENVMAARFLCSLKRTQADCERGRQALASISTPAALDEQGRMLGAYLLALHEAGWLKLP